MSKQSYNSLSCHCDEGACLPAGRKPEEAILILRLLRSLWSLAMTLLEGGKHIYQKFLEE